MGAQGREKTVGRGPGGLAITWGLCTSQSAPTWAHELLSQEGSSFPGEKLNSGKKQLQMTSQVEPPQKAGRSVTGWKAEPAWDPQLCCSVAHTWESHQEPEPSLPKCRPTCQSFLWSQAQNLKCSGLLGQCLLIPRSGWDWLGWFLLLLHTTYGDYLPPGRARPPSSIRVKCRRGRGCRGAGLLAREPGWLSVRICPGQREVSSVYGYHRGPWEGRSTQSPEQVSLASSKGRWPRHYCSERTASTNTHSSDASSGSQEPDKKATWV